MPDERGAVRDLLRDLGFAMGEGFLIETWVYGGFVWFEMGGKLQYKTWENNEHGKWHEYTTRKEFLAWFLGVVEARSARYYSEYID